MASGKISRPRVRGWTLLVGLAALMPSVAAAQGYRGWASTSLQMVEMRPFGVDTVPRADVTQDSQGRFLYNGLEVSCVLTDECTGYVPLPEERTLAATEDVSLTLWGFGMQGLSATAMVRVRAHAGGDLVWPRYDRDFDAMLAYAQLQRGPLRLRAGRQEVRSGLGFSAFDGVSAVYGLGSLRGEVYGGRSLARGLRQPENEALRPLDDFFLDKSVLLLGASVGGRLHGVTADARYHREILSDRSSLVSERASLDMSASLPRVRVTGSIDYDIGFESWGKGHVTLSAPLSEGRWLVEVSANRYRPYFDLSTLWGFFEPVSYSELTTRLGWSPTSKLGAWVSGGWRTYGDTHTAVILQPLRDTGWRGDAGARWALSAQWVVDGRYELEWGPGGFLNSGDAAVRYTPVPRLTASLSALTFQEIEEYRLGQGRAFGLSASAEFEWRDWASLSGGFSMVRYRDGGTVLTSPWNQARAWTGLKVDLGADPGLANRGAER